MRTFPYAIVASFVVLMLVAGCKSESSAPGEGVRVSAAVSAGKVTPGMDQKKVEETFKSQGTPDANDPNIVHYPTEDGDVRVTYANGIVANITASSER